MYLYKIYYIIVLFQVKLQLAPIRKVTRVTNDDVEVRYEEPASILAGTEKMELLKQRIAELNASLTAVNKERPSKSKTNDYKQWVDRRGRLISAQRKTTAEYQFIKGWVNQARTNELRTDTLPSKELFRFAHLMLELEDLVAKVGVVIASGVGTEQWSAMVKAHEKVASHYAIEPDVGTPA